MFQCVVKQRKDPHEILDFLIGVVTKRAQVGCDQHLSYHSVVWDSFFKMGPVLKEACIRDIVERHNDALVSKLSI